MRKLGASTALAAFACAAGCATPQSPTTPAPPAAASPAPEAPPADPVASYLQKQALALEAIPGAQVTRKSDALVVTFADALLFEGGGAALSPEGAARVRSLAGTVAGDPSELVIVKAHSDAAGDTRASQRLCEDRASRVRDLLVAEGVAPSRLTAFGLGASLPVASDASEQGRLQNQRVEVELRPDLDQLAGRGTQ